jgi:hypothetical protein
MSTPSTLSNMIFDGIFEAHHAQILSCFGPGVGAWFIVRPIFLGWQLVFPIFSTTFWIQLQLPHPSIVSIFQCVCTHPIDPIGIHLLHCVHVNECIKTYDTVCDTFAAIVYDVGFHMGWEQLHALLLNTFNSSHQRVDIVLIKDDTCTLVDIVVIDPTWVDLFFRSCTTQRFVTSDAAQTKEWNYCEWHPIDQFLPLIVEIFGCLHK